MPSPFSPTIPRLQVAWDSTSISLANECWRKYQLSMLLNWHSPGVNIHLEFGGAYAKARENFHHARAQGADYEEAVLLGTKFCLSWDDTPFEQDKKYSIKNRHTLARTFVWHAEQYRDDAYQVLILDNGLPAVELTFQVPLDISTPDGDPYTLCGHLDSFGTFQGEFYFLDDKTTGSALTDSYFAQYNPNTQMTNYFFASKVIYKKEAKGGIVSAAQLGVNFTRFGRRFIHRTPGQMAEWHRNLQEFFRLALYYAEINYYPMNTNSCSNYGGCPFRGICSLDPEQRDDFLRGEFDKWEWNPLEARGDL